MSAPTPSEHWRSICLALFPWLAHFGVIDATKRLEVRSDGAGLDIEGGGPAAVRVGDLWGRLYLQATGGTYTLWYSAQDATPYTWTSIATGIAPPLPTDAGTRIALPVGSTKVTIG